MEFLQFFLSSSDEGHQLIARSWPDRSPAPGPSGMFRCKKNALLFWISGKLSYTRGGRVWYCLTV